MRLLWPRSNIVWLCSVDATFHGNYNVATARFYSFLGIFAVIKARIVKVGNSQGIRIPKTLLEQSGLKTEVVIEVKGDALIIRNAQSPRENWDLAFQAMAERGDDRLLDGPTSTEWEEAEWDWS
jgi:antitoxin MazE